MLYVVCCYVVWHCVAVAGHGAGVICFMTRGNSTGHGVLWLCVPPPPPPPPPPPWIATPAFFF
jgi:hypothetical protein